MTDPIDDETKPHTTSPDGSLASPPTSEPRLTPPASDAPRDAGPADGAPARSAPPAEAASDESPTRAGGSSLRVDPDRPSTNEWREPPWFPPEAKNRDRGPTLAAVVVGVGLIAIGLYFFLDRTLGVPMPRIQWGTVWPILLIGLGAIVLFRSVSRRS